MAAEIFDQQVKIGVCHNTDIPQSEQHPFEEDIEQFIESLSAKLLTQVERSLFS